ncbi:putative rhodanese sulfurtransferase [Azoarcus olearius]|uniref:rhodanese-like domain-containing protein n=1 Tax=Azoarcus sp. (strain BH72) TaxID=418699 RepID=UPI0008063D15|nr:rhodanese-like domain-containing protein [Azoarcus olearius]ANQ85508.1 putative rhodanese sulfurtransferase [Azoarcus olearius]
MKSKISMLAFALAAVSPLAFAQNAAPAASATPAAAAWKYTSPKLDRGAIDKLLRAPDKVVFIDVRQPDEVSKIGGFPVYLSIQAGDLEKQLAYIPRERRVVTLSNHAGRAGAAADLLASKGFKVAGAVGVQNYEEEGGTLTKIAPRANREAASAEATRR